MVAGEETTGAGRQESADTRRPERDRGPVIVALVVLAVLAWNILAWRIIGNRPRTWSYGTARAIPAESYGSSQPPPPAAQAPKQVELPPPAAPQQPFGSAQGHPPAGQQRVRR